MIAALLAAALVAAPVGPAARVAPGTVDAALLLSDADALAGVRAFLESAGALAPALDPKELSKLVRGRLGVDLLAAAGGGREFSLGMGPRVVVVLGRSVGLSAPVRSRGERAARGAARAWVAEGGGLRRARRAGKVATVQGAPRLLLASGPEAGRLVQALAAVGARGRPALSRRPDVRAALDQLAAPAAIWVRGEAPLRGAVLGVRGSATELAGDGVLLSARELLAGPAPAAAACDGGPLLCVRAGLAPGGKQFLMVLARHWIDLALSGPRRDLLARLLPKAAAALRGPAVLRIEEIDVDALGALSDPLFAAPFVAAGAQAGFSLDGLRALPRGVSRRDGGLAIEAPRPLCLRADGERLVFGDACDKAPADVAGSGDAEALAILDAPLLARQLGRATPLTALRGPLSAGAYTARLLFGKLLAASEPLTARGHAGERGVTRLELRWRLRPR